VDAKGLQPSLNTKTLGHKPESREFTGQNHYDRASMGSMKRSILREKPVKGAPANKNCKECIIF